MSSPQWRFADFRLDPDNACLWRGTQPLALTPKAFEVLQYLVTHPDRLVTKDTLLDAVWPEIAISDTVVRIAIGELRRALGDTAQAPRFIATVHRRGYHFLAPVTVADLPESAHVEAPLRRAMTALSPQGSLPLRPHIPPPQEPSRPLLRGLWRPARRDLPRLWTGGTYARHILPRMWAPVGGPAT